MSAKKKALLMVGSILIAAVTSVVALKLTGKKISLEITDAA